jgi:hypothetical protein
MGYGFAGQYGKQLTKPGEQFEEKDELSSCFVVVFGLLFAVVNYQTANPKHQTVLSA